MRVTKNMLNVTVSYCACINSRTRPGPQRHQVLRKYSWLVRKCQEQPRASDIRVIRDAQNHTVQPLQVIFHIKVWVSIGLPFPAESTWSSGHVGPFNICSILKQPAPRAAATPAALKQDCARNGGGPGFRTTQHNKMNINEPQ